MYIYIYIFPSLILKVTYRRTESWVDVSDKKTVCRSVLARVEPNHYGNSTLAEIYCWEGSSLLVCARTVLVALPQPKTVLVYKV